jgi:hypothetical protein
LEKTFGITNAYFYVIKTEHAHQANYAHRMVCIAEGLAELGINCYSNFDYWKNRDGSFLMKYAPEVIPNECDIVFFEDHWAINNLEWPSFIYDRGRKCIIVYFEQADNIYTPALKEGFPNFDFVFKAQMNRRFIYPSNFYPDVFGLSKRIIDYTQSKMAFQERESNILVNFRVAHSLRSEVVKNYLPKINKNLEVQTIIQDMNLIPENEYDAYLWFNTGRRHHPDYYELLKKTKVCTCVGGGLFQAYPVDYYNKSVHYKFLRRFFKYTENFFGTKRIIQFDSWRFWETFGAGGVALHIDLDKYGAFLPVMPKNFVEYIGIDLEKPKKSLEVLMSGDEYLSKIAENGSKWAKENYSPKASALRLLSIINNNRK